MCRECTDTKRFTSCLEESPLRTWLEEQGYDYFIVRAKLTRHQ